MAQKYIVRCKDATQTSGTGTLTLDNSSSANWQTPAQAVTRTLLANGNTVRYTISDTSNPVIYEEGIGTIGSAGLTLTRDTVRQSSSGTSKISWPSGGARDVVISWSPGDTALISNQGADYAAATFATNLGLPRLAAANTYTESQVITDDVAAGNFRALDLKNSATPSTGNRVAISCFLNDSAGVEEIASQLRARLTTLTAGAENGQLEFFLASAGTITERLRLASDGALTAQPGGNKYDAFPSGQVLLSESVPTGWTRGDVTGGRLIKLATSADTLGAQAGSEDIFDGSWGTQGAVLTIAQIPSHDHQIINDVSTGFVNFGGGSSTAFVSSATAISVGENRTEVTGSGDSHSHSMTLPNYRVMGRIVKN